MANRRQAWRRISRGGCISGTPPFLPMRFHCLLILWDLLITREDGQFSQCERYDHPDFIILRVSPGKSHTAFPTWLLRVDFGEVLHPPIDLLLAVMSTSDGEAAGVAGPKRTRGHQHVLLTLGTNSYFHVCFPLASPGNCKDVSEVEYRELLRLRDSFRFTGHSGRVLSRPNS